MSKKIYAPFFILAFIYISFAQSGLKFIAKKEKFKAGEDVCFELINNSKETFYLPSSAPWVVFEDETEKIIYSPIALQRIEKLKPGEKKSWCWKQIDINQDKVPSGDYKIRITLFSSKGKKEFLSINVKILPKYKN